MLKRLTIVFLAFTLSACELTPTQRKWATVGVSIVATGLIVAHEQDKGRGALVASGKNGGKNLPGQCSGSPQDCK